MISCKTKMWTFLALFMMAGGAYAQSHDHSSASQPTDKSHTACPMMQAEKAQASDHAQGHTAHLDEVNTRGEKAMGFSQTATTHHFLLSRDGGSIEVEA